MRDLGENASGLGSWETPARSGGLCPGLWNLAWGALEQARCLGLLTAHASRGFRLGSTRGASGAPAMPGLPAIGQGHCEGGASLNRAVL